MNGGHVNLLGIGARSMSLENGNRAAQRNMHPWQHSEVVPSPRESSPSLHTPASDQDVDEIRIDRTLLNNDFPH